MNDFIWENNISPLFGSYTRCEGVEGMKWNVEFVRQTKGKDHLPKMLRVEFYSQTDREREGGREGEREKESC